MKEKKSIKRILSLVLVACMVLAFALPANAVSKSSDVKVNFEKVDNSAVSNPLDGRVPAEEKEDTPAYKDTDEVRVSIVLKGKSTIEAGYSTRDIATNRAAMKYRDKLEATQEAVTEKISARLGEDLDVVWNLTLAANIISANVEYGQISEIEKVSGVKEVLIETRYEPDVVEKTEAGPEMATSNKQIGSAVAWAAGYTGAGSRIAIIDTGTDIEHQSFSPAGFEYSLAYLAGKAGMTVDEYKASLDLLDADEIAAVAGELNAEIDPDQAYINSKVPFGYNYVDDDYKVTHVDDKQGEHGSHVSGIAAANAYIPNADGTFSPALSSVYVQGVAPDAQIITMKVFGKGGGAYDSDYMVAIEDAIILGADSVNLSLGSGNPGPSRELNYPYQDILDKLTETDTVVTMSAGNSGSWVENAYNIGYLYSTDVSMQTDGSPGSYTNSLAVASVDNDGVTANYISVGDLMVFYTETTGYKNEPFTSIGGEQDYVLIDGFGTPKDWEGIDLEGKIALCSRGSTTWIDDKDNEIDFGSFFEKANVAVEKGALATIIYNNQPGVINMDLTDYKYTAPCVSITQADGAAIKAASTPVTDDNGNVLYYTGKMTVGADVATVQYDSDYYTMSSFSSWGVPGSLELKPEITAPGGNIYSVFGHIPNGGGGYESMSGTSMAAPQVTGMAALVAQYIRENGLEGKVSLTVRALSQSLLMSTAVPMRDAESGGNYYPVLQQGAGLANVGAAVSADSYILMGKDATASYADGKVKVELGDDPQKTGDYTFSFSINNLTDVDKTYTLSADFFTQDAFVYYANGNMSLDQLAIYLDTWCAMMEVATTFTVDGAEVDSVTVPADGSAEVKVTVALSEDEKAFLDAYYPNGAYVEGYVYAESAASEEGVAGTSHSIPVLGFYGNWSDASMFEVGSYAEYATGDEYKLPYLGDMTVNTYLVSYPDEPSLKYVFGGNPLVPDDSYLRERDAINSESVLSGVSFAAIRNAAASKFTAVNETTGETLAEAFRGAVSSAFYYTNGGSWQQTGYTLNTKLALSGTSEGDVIKAGLTLAPEYYVDAEGNVDWDALGEGATFGTQAVVDNTAPELFDVSVSLTGNTMTATASDNNYVAAVALYNKAGTKVLAYTGAKQDIEKGEVAEYTFSLEGVNGKKFLLQVFDYAMNVTTYAIEMQIGEEVPLPEMIAFDLDYGYWTSFDKTTTYDELAEYAPSEHTFFAATIVDHMVLASTDGGDLYIMPEDDLTDLTYVGNVGNVLTDMAYNKVDGKVYAVDQYGWLVEVDKLTGELTDVAEIGVLTNTLACDEDGTFYCNGYGTGSIYSFTLQGGGVSEPEALDINGDGVTDEADGQALLDYATGAVTELANADLGDLDGDGDIDSYDSYLFFTKLENGDFEPAGPISKPVLVVDDIPVASQYLQAMEINPNTGMLCWNSFYLISFWGFTFGFSYYYEIDTETGEYIEYEDLWDELSCLIIPEKTSGGGNWTAPTDEVSGLKLSAESLTILKGGQKTLTATVQPWTATDRTVTWTSADESVATVNAKGVVTGVGVGTTTVTATSNLDPSFSATCEVTVEALNITVKGTLQDEDGTPLFYEWNMATDDTWTAGNVLDTSMTSATYSTKEDAYYVMDAVSNTWAMHKVGKDGVTIQAAANGAGVPLWDMQYSEYFSEVHGVENVSSIYYYYFLAPKDPMNLDTDAFNLSDRVGYLTGITSLGYEEYWDEEEGVMLDTEHIVLLDNVGTIWNFWIYDTDEGMSAWLNSYPSNLPCEFPGDDTGENMYTSMVVGDDGNLYVSSFNGETNELYRMIFDAATETYIADLIGDVGQDVWPATITEVTTNAPAEGEGFVAPKGTEKMTAEVVTAEELAAVKAPEAKTSAKTFTATAEAKAAKAETVKSEPTGLKSFAPDTVVAPLSTGVYEDGILTVEVSTDVLSYNGVATVTFDPAALTLIDATVNATYTSKVEAEGAVTVGYVELAGIEADASVATLTFEVLDAVNDDVTVSFKEVNDGTGSDEVIDETCDHVETEVKDAVEATCTADGYTGDTVCSACGALLEAGEVVPAAGHVHELVDAKLPTCTEEGYTGDTVCSVCDELLVQGEAIAATGHSYKDVVTDPTTEEEGYTTHTCENCGHSYKDSYTEKLPAPTEPEDPDNSETGDTFAATLWITIMVISVVGLAALAINRKKWFIG